MSITCALSDSQIEKLFKLTYKRMKDSLDSDTEFDAEDFMKDLFNKIAGKQDAETAAKFIQHVPAMVYALSAKSAFKNLDFKDTLNESAIKKLSRQFKSDTGISDVVSRYQVKPDVLPGKVEREADNANKIELNQIPIPEEPVTVIESDRFKTLSPWGGTLQNYIKINPNKKSDGSVVIEEINPEKAHIIKTFENIKQIQAMSDLTDGIIYEGKKLMFRAENLDLFARGENLDMLDKETRDEIAASRTIINNKSKVDPAIAQVNQRVILVLTDEFGNNIYVDNEGKITDKETGKLVYQFMRTVRKQGNKYTVKDIYNQEDQVLSPEEFARMTYNPEIDGTKREYFDKVVAEQQKQMKELYDLQQKALKNEAKLLPVTGITTGISSNLSSTTILLNELTKFPGITADVYSTIETAPRDTATLRKGEATIEINGNTFAIDRPRITKDIADEVASVLTNPNIPLAAKKGFVDQFLPSSLDIQGSAKKYKFSFDKDLKYLYFNEYKDFKFKNPVDEKGKLLTDTNLKKLSAEEVKNIKDRIVNVLMNGGIKNNIEGQSNAVFMSYDSSKFNKNYQRLSEDGSRFIDKSYNEFLSTLPAEIKIINADPGFYNYSVSYTTPDSTLGKVIESNTRQLSFDEELALEAEKLKNDPATIESNRIINQANSEAWRLLVESDPTVKVKPVSEPVLIVSYLRNQIATNPTYTKEFVTKVFDNILGAYWRQIGDAQSKLINDEINKRFPEPINSKELTNAETLQILTEPGAPAPESTDSAVSEIFKSNGKIDLDSIPGSFDRKGFDKERINPLKVLRAKKWWNSEEIKPLRDLISFEHAANLVNSDVFATFIVNAAYIADTNDKMGTIKVNKLNGSFYQNLTAYHEAWHVFSQLFLTKEQKIDLYTELQNYTDANGNQPYANKKFRELEEMLAEDFRNYVKSGKAKENAPKRNTIFRQILNFLKQLFGKYLNKFKKKDIQLDSLNSPMAKELFDNLFLGRFNSYQASVDNVVLYDLDRGVRQVNNPKEDALSPQDGNQMVKTIDSIFSEKIDDIYDTRVIEARKQIAETALKEGIKVTPEYIEKQLHTKGLKSASVLMLTDTAKRAWLYGETKNSLQEILKSETAKLEKVKGQKDFNKYATLKEISDNAVAVMKNKKGEDKYFFLASQIDDFSKLDPSLKRGERVRGEDYKGSIKILGDFYKHKEITKDGRPVDIVIISKIQDAELQFQNYKNAEKQKAYTEVILNKNAKNILVDDKQQLVRDNIRILQNTLANWGDEKSGMVKYHMENTDYEIGKNKFDIEVQSQSKQEIDQDGNVIDETEVTEGATTDPEVKPGTQSLQQMMSKETTYLIKSLFKVNPDGTTPTDRFGVKERADFNKVFTILAKTIGGERDRYKAYAKLAEESEKFPELKQLYEKKYPDPNNITNTHEMDISVRFWQDFGKFRVKYMQLFAFNDSDSNTIDFRVKESSIAIDNTLNRWMALFKSTQATSYINKGKDNVSTLNLANLVKDFGTKGELAKKDAIDFARAMAIDLDNNDNIKKELADNFDYYGLAYIFDIVKGFNEINNLKEGDPELTAERVKYLDMFKKNPIDVLKNIIPVGVLSTLKGSVKELTQLKRLAELQSKYGFDSATTGVIRANGNTGYQEMNWSSAASYVYALNEVTEMHQLWTDPRYNYMSYLNPAINPHTLQLSIIKSLFDANGKKIPGKSVLLMAVDGTSMSNKKTVTKNGRQVEIEEAEGNTTTELDPQSKFLQELHTMLLGGVAEFPRHSEKKFSYGIKVVGGIEGSSVGYLLQGTDKNLYVDMDMFTKTDEKGRLNGEIYAIGNNILPYIQGEFDRIKKFRGANKEEYLKITGYNKLVDDGNGNDAPAGSVFSAFDSVLRQETKDALYKLADEQIDVPLVDYLRGKPLRKMMADDIIDYFNEKTNELDTLYFQKMPFLSKSIFEKLGYKADELTSNKINSLKLDKTLTDRILKAYLYNDFIHKYESAMLVYGDHAQWGHDKEDWTKRIPGLTSDGTGFLFDKGMKSFIKDNFNKVTYASLNMPNIPADKKFIYGENLNTAVIKDAVRDSLYLDDMVKAWKEEYAGTYDSKTIDELIKKDIKPFMGMKEGDGMAYMTFDAYRTLHKTGGKGWTLAQESLYQRIIKGEKVNPKTVKDYFPVYKLHYFGAIQNSIAPVRAMHKFAVIPLIPGVNAQEGSELDILHKKMLKENIQYVAFDSCSKGANLTSDGKVDNIFTSKDDKAIKEDAEFTVNPIYMANLKEVTVINEHFKGSLPIATQTRGILLDNLYKEGKLINEKNKPVLDEYLSAVKDYSEILKEELLSEIGFEFIDGRAVGNLKQFVEVIRDELKNRDTPEHLIRLLNTANDRELAMDLSLHPEADTVEKLIMSFLQNGLIKQKTNGEPLVQTPTTFTNGIWDSQYTALTDLEEIKKWMGSNTLPFYLRNAGERSTEMKVAVALQGEFIKLLNDKHTDGEKISTIDRLNEVIKDPKWLEANKDAVTMFGPRIPNDATNTIEAATVWHFLPEAFGNSIIVPTEIVAKAGSDFDGDKLFMTFSNIDNEGKVISKGVDKFETLLKETQALEKANKPIKGRPSSRALIAEQKKYLQNRFKNAAVEILMLPENYAYLTKPNGTYLVDKYVAELEENKKGYNRYKNTHGQAPKLSAADENGKRKTVISPTRVLEATYNLYKHDANLSLEPSLGIMAKLAKSHPIYKSVGALMPATYRASAFIEALNKTIETGFTLPVVMRFAHNKTRNAMGQEVISLSGERTQSGSRISDVTSHALQGILDRAKESFPFELKLVPEAMDVFSYMLQAGVDEEQIFFFLNQPLIAEYFEKQKLKESAYSKIVGSKEKGSPANNIINNLLKNFDQASLNPLYDRINVAKLRYVLNGLKTKGEDQTYYFKIKKDSGIKEITLKDLLDRLNSGGLAPQNIERISTMPNMSNDSTVYFYSNAINSTENFAFATEVLSNEYLPKGDVPTKTLKDGVKDNKTMKALALFMNYLELERQFKGMNDLQQTFSPDTGKLTTVQQVLKRMEAYEELRKSKSIDQDFLNRLLKESILSSFNQDDLIKQLTEPLFNLRLNPEITKYISDAFVDQSKASRIRNNPTFGKGINGQERFSTLFNNGVINYIYQNYLSNFSNEKGELVNIPDTYKDNRPVIKVDNLDTDVEIVEEGIAINTRRIETDYANKAYLETSVAENNYGSRGLDTFKIKDDPFQTLASYYRYVIARESNRVNHPIESLENNSEFMRRVYAMGNANDAYESYISERALGASFNNKYIMGKTKYSYSDSLLNLINEFGDTLKVNYPITAQLSPGTNTEGAKVLQLNNQKEAQGELASVYYNNLRNLADPSVTKVQNKNKTDEENESDNQRISEMFNLFSLNMFYQHGVGKTRLGFIKALDPVQYKDIVEGGSKAFLKNYLSTEILDEIFNTVVSMDKFKNYLVSPEGYIHSDLATTETSKPTNDGTLETFDDSEGEDEVLVRLINQEDVNAFNDYVKKSGGKRPEKFFTSKTLYPAFYNSATGKREGMPQTAIWIKNQYGTYDMLDQETGEFYYENVNLATGMQITKKEDVQPTQPTVLTGFQGYKGGFPEQQTINGKLYKKGSENGDPKDYAMREIAGGFILELDPKRENDSSTGTTAKEYPNYREGVMVGSKNFYNDIVMLARNNEFKNKPLSEETKASIKDAHDEGVSFVVGDMPGVDSQFIDYLQEIGAKFTIYHTGTTPRVQVTQAPTQPSEVKIEPTDKIIWGHPTIGKSFLKKNQDNRFISLDDDYATEINTKVKEIADKYNVTTYQVKDGDNQQWNTEYNEMMQNLFDKAKAVALSENKILFTSNTNLLKNNAAAFDKVINLTDKEFQKRISERGAKYDTAEWKKQIEDAVSKIPSNKVIVTDKYLSDLLPTQPSTTSTSESVADIPQNKVSGINSYGSTVTANNEAIKALGPNPHSIDMIEAGFRTRTTRSESEMAKYAIKVGDTIKHFGKSADGSTKTVYAKVTAIHPKGSEGWKGTWNKEGWRAEDVNVIDRFKDGAAAIEFEVIQPSTQPTEAPVSNTNKPKGEEVVPGIYVNQAALSKEEQLELFDYLKPYLEEQADKSLKATQGSKMIGLGLRWDYTSNNPGKTTVNIPDPIKRNPKYGYYNQSVNGQPLGQITPRFRELMQKATGVDMTNYDGAIINLYEKDTFISSHNDVDESKSAVKYPVIGINLGGKGNFSIERIPGAGQLSLEAGTGYIFGVDGVNREVWHRTFPTPQDTFLPELTTKIDGKTYPAGSYRVTITMRRVMPLEPSMPTAPAKITTQPVSQPTEVKEGVQDIFNSNPELASIGTPEQYSQYLDTIFPDSKVKDIVYRGAEKGIEKHRAYSHWTLRKAIAENFAKQGVNLNKKDESKNTVYFALLNIKNLIRSIEITDKEHKERGFDAAASFPNQQKPDGTYYKNEEANESIQLIDKNLNNEITVFEPEQIHILGNKEDLKGFKQFVQGKQSVNVSVSPKPEATIDTDINVYKDLLAKNNGVQPQTFTSENRMYRLNKFGNYDLVDKTTGEIYMRNINMETGKQETEPGLDSPVDPVAKQAALDKIITLRATINIEEQLAVMGYDINDIINNLANAKTQEDFNKITKILDKLC